jgi:hypothetical protein
MNENPFDLASWDLPRGRRIDAVAVSVDRDSFEKEVWRRLWRVLDDLSRAVGGCRNPLFAYDRSPRLRGCFGQAHVGHGQQE